MKQNTELETKRELIETRPRDAKYIYCTTTAKHKEFLTIYNAIIATMVEFTPEAIDQQTELGDNISRLATKHALYSMLNRNLI